ncbi:transcription factor 25-like isoform X1 [Pomacea canaliculata]|uniref:transcription factor 25-like isoform X1 n=1 Tax=Pomacea canaliculata TaxID=400727 RepID=UPI000D7265EB|nr:transcription factor 25-like isoform X1 [Pomacea canaliculata]
MSNRALKKLQPQTDAYSLPDVDLLDNTDVTDDLPCHSRKGKQKKPANLFAVLMENGDEDKDNEPVDEASGACERIEDGSTNSGKKKRPKKKKKKKQDVTHEVSTSPVEVEDEVEASIQEVNRILGNSGFSLEDSSKEANVELSLTLKALLSVEYKNLNADAEMRKIFGSHVVQAEHGRGRHRNRTSQRSGRLVQPKENWPVFGRTGLSMTMMHQADSKKAGAGNSQCFTFEHSPQYQQVQFLFLDAVQSYNPQNIANIIHEHPYHIDSLIQLSEIFRMSEDLQTAVDLIERAIHVFEYAFHPLFNIATGNCRLDFRRQENRAFFLVLFKHLVNVGQRGCNRTALEFCKLLLNLDPDGDPLCVLLMIDFYALRSEQYTFLIRMYEEWESSRNLLQLPNFAFSVPLAMFHLAGENENYVQKADEMLADALLMFPGLLMPLLNKCGICPDKEVSNHSFFGASSQSSQSPALLQLVTLYVNRCHACWKEPEVLFWLEKVVKSTLQRVDAGDPRVQNFAEKRKMRYQGTPRNIYRHFIISEIKDATATLPPELVNTPVLTYDPLPPQDAVVSYTRPQRPRAAEQNVNPLSLFVRSLLPNFGLQEAELDTAVAGIGVGGLGEAEDPDYQEHNELRRGVGALMNAMRDLLNNIRLAPPPVENGQIGQEEEEEERDGEADDEEWN